MFSIFKKIKKPKWLTYSNVFSTLSFTKRYVEKGLVYASRYATVALAGTAIGASAINYGMQLDTDTQLKKTIQSNNIQNVQLLETQEQLAENEKKLEETTKSLDETFLDIQKKQDEVAKTLNDQSQNSDVISNSLFQISGKTIKAEADLKEVQGKIDNANEQLKNTTENLNVLDEKTKKTIEDIDIATEELLATKSQLEAQITALNQHVDDNLLAIDSSFQSVYSSVSSGNSRLDDADMKFTQHEALFASLQQQIDSTNTILSSFQSSQSSVNSAVSSQNANNLDYQTQNESDKTAISGILQSLVTQNSSLSASILAVSQNIQYFSVDQNSINSGTINFTTQANPPTVFAFLGFTFGGGGTITVTNVTTSSFDYTVTNPGGVFYINYLLLKNN